MATWCLWIRKIKLVSCGKLTYNEKTGYGFATIRALAKDYSQKDTLYAHSDTMKIYTFNINTDSVYRKVHCYRKVRTYRTDMQAVCDSMVINTKDSCMTMYITYRVECEQTTVGRGDKGIYE